MGKTEKLALIEGAFSYEEAREILMDIFSSKIDYHEMKNFSSVERLGMPDEIAAKRIPELKSCMDKVLEMVAEAKLNNKKLRISSEINISLSDSIEVEDIGNSHKPEQALRQQNASEN